jgi:hypothetical protein
MAMGLDLADESLELDFTPCADNELCRGATDARRSAGDECDLILKT